VKLEAVFEPILQKSTSDNLQTNTRKQNYPRLTITRHNPFYDWAKGDPLA